MTEPKPFKITVDESLSGVLVALEEFTGDYGPSYNIDIDVGGERFRLKEGKSRVDREFQHQGVNRDTIIGRTVKFWKKPMADNPAKGYLNMDLLDTGRTPTPITTPKPTTTAKEPALPAWLEPEVKELRLKAQLEEDMIWCWNKAWDTMAPKIEGVGGVLGDPMTLQAIQAMAVAGMIRLEHARR